MAPAALSRRLALVAQPPAVTTLSSLRPSRCRLGKRSPAQSPLLRRRVRAAPAGSDDADAPPPPPAPEAAAASTPLPPPPLPPLPRAVSLPIGLPTAGAVFVMAGALKLLIMCFPFTEMAVMMWVRGRADLGLTAMLLKALPLALGLAALAKAVVDRGLHLRRWSHAVIVGGGVLALLLSRLIFAGPKPSPLDPMFRRVNQDRTAALVGEGRREAAQQQRLQRQQRQGHRLQQPDSAHGRALEEQQRQAKQLQQKQQQQASGKSSS